MASGCIESIVINGRRFTTDGEDTCEITYNGFQIGLGNFHVHRDTISNSEM